MKKPQQRLMIIQLLTLTALPIILQQIKCNQLIETGSNQQELRSLTIKAHNQELLVAKKLAPDNHSPPAPAVGRQSSQNRTTSVSDLRLAPDFRAARLRWTYRREGELHQQHVEPASFDVRFCELTAWNAEIKCRHREMLANTTTTDNSVIQTTKPVADGQQLTVLRQNNDLIEYEAQIFDLRALTNYTFHVRVLRFSDEPAQAQSDSQLDNQQRRTSKVAPDRSSLARRLSVDEQAANEILARVETKPFRAEATKCLADVSEVVVTTGKYFGGRITVEGSLDKRCQLIGNKSSEQTSYVFRIDHEICHSRVINENRIETMILVHENKDILTHNTARFLVLCNFLQKSFTLRASISLPKVNGIMGNRPAVITPLQGKPSKEKSVQLGSMPGVFRAKPSDLPTETSNITHGHTSNELDTQSSEERNSLGKVMNSDSRQRQPKVLHQRQRPRLKSIDLLQAEASSTSPAAAQTPAQMIVPAPVRIQSKLLYVDRQPIANLVAAKIIPPRAVEIGSDRSTSSRGDNRTQQPKNDLEGRGIPVKTGESSIAEDDSIILTNNHRVVGDFRPTSSLKLAPDSRSSFAGARDDGDLSIKYSGAARMSDYSVGQLELPTAGQTNHSENLMSRHRGERTGRMHNIDSPAAAGDQIAGRDYSLQTSATGTNRRMGDMMLETTGADLLAETSNNDSEIIQSPFNQSTSFGDNNSPPPIVQENSNPVQNLTNYLLKWSLKTLTNLAKKSLQSLANRSDSSLLHNEHSPVAAASDNDDDDDDDEEPVSRPTLEKQQQPVMVVGPRTIVTTTRPPAVSLSLSSSLKPEISTSDGFDTHSRPQLQQRVQTRLANTATSRSQSISTSTSAPPIPASTVSVNGAQPAIKHATHLQQQRASNYSKSLDLDKLDSAAKARQLHQPRQVKATPAAQDQARDYLARSNESGQHMRHDLDAHIPDYHGSMSWLLVGCLLVLALAMSIMTIFCLASSHQLSPFAPSHSHPLPTHRRVASALPKTASSLPRLVFNRTVAGDHGQSNETLNSQADMLPSYSERYDYDRFQNHARTGSASSSPSSSSSSSSSQLGKNGGGCHRADSSAASSASGSSIDGDSTNRLAPLGNRQTTQSGQLSGQLAPASLSICNSAGTTSHLPPTLGDEEDENNCTNSELLLTEHVLFGGAHSRNESYA